jgi:methionyl-tRNA synthetase
MCIPEDARDFAALERDEPLETVRVDNPKPAFPRLEMPESEPA